MRQAIIFSLFFLGQALNSHGQNNVQHQTFVTDCDSIYRGKGYKIVQQYFTEGIDGSRDNTIFSFLKTEGNNEVLIFRDTVFSQFGEIIFRDFNDDKVKDILIQNTSDVRSNRTYYLYLVDTKKNKLRKITGFEEIKNPNYLPQYDLVDNYVMSGQIWTGFYEIKGDSIIDHDTIIYDDLTDKGAYEKNYRDAVKTILKKRKSPSK